MAVTSVTEIWDSRDGSSDEMFVDTLTRQFRVRTDSMLDGPSTISVANGLPRRWDIYQDPNGFPDLFARCQKLAVKQTDDPFTWIATATYTSKRVFKEEAKQAQKGGNQVDQNPLNRPPDISWSLTTYQRAVAFDASDGRPIMNSAADKFDPPIEIDDSRLVLVYSRNEATFTAQLALDYQDAVNSGVWRH
jgi:hypothetical protein